MSEFSKFYEETFNDGTSPGINADRLNEIERVVALADQELAYSETKKLSELLKYFAYKNTKLIDTLYDYSLYTNAYSSNCTLSEDDNNQIIGNSCTKDTAIVATAGWMSFYMTGLGLDLSKFEDDVSSSTTDDFIILVVYVSDKDAFDEIELRLGSDSSNVWFWQSSYGPYTFVDGWNVIAMQKSDFTTGAGSPDWSDIDYVRYSPYLNAGYSGEYMLFNYLIMHRVDADNAGWANPFQKYLGSVTGWENVFDLVDVSNQYFLMYQDHNNEIVKLGLMKPMGGSNVVLLHVYCSVIEFISKFEMHCKEAGETSCITWYIDTLNYASVYISGDTLYMDVWEAGVKTAQSKALSGGLAKDEMIYIYFEKKDDTFRIILTKVDEIPIILEYETSIDSSSDGCIYIGTNDNDSLSFISDFEIGNIPIRKLPNETLPLFISQKADQNFASTTLANITNLYAWLPPDGIYKVDVCIAIVCDSASPEFRLQWEVTNATSLTGRRALGPAPSVTDVADMNVKMSDYAYGTSVIYGCDGSANESWFMETGILKTGNVPGKIQLKGSQWYSYPSNPVIVKERSYIFISKVNAQIT